MSDNKEVPLTEMQKLERLVGEPIKRQIYVNGVSTEFELARIKVGRIPRIAQAAGSLMIYLGDTNQKMDFAKLMMFHSSDCLELLAALLNKPRNLIDELDIDDAVLLLTDVCELNLDFFVRRVLPVFSGALQRLMEDAKNRKAKLLEVIGSPASSS